MTQNLVGHCRGQTKTKVVEREAQIHNEERGSNPLKGFGSFFLKRFSGFGQIRPGKSFSFGVERGCRLLSN